VSTHKPVAMIFGFQRTEVAGQWGHPPQKSRTDSASFQLLYRRGSAFIPRTAKCVKGFSSEKTLGGITFRLLSFRPRP